MFWDGRVLNTNISCHKNVKCSESFGQAYRTGTKRCVSGVRHCLGFCSADSLANKDNKSAVQKPKHYLTQDFLSALVIYPAKLCPVATVQGCRVHLREARGAAGRVRGPVPLQGRGHHPEAARNVMCVHRSVVGTS